MSSEIIECGRALKVKWVPPDPEQSAKSPITKYEINLHSPSDHSKQIFNLSSDKRSYTFFGLKVNAVYQVSLRARNSEGFGLPAKEQVTTTAGKNIGMNK